MTAGSTAHAYEAHGRLSHVTPRNGAYADYLYDRGGRLTRLANYYSAYSDGQGTTRRLSTAFDYTYDANSNITEVSQNLNGAELITRQSIAEKKRRILLILGAGEVRNWFFAACSCAGPRGWKVPVLCVND